MKKITLLLLMLFISFAGFSQFSEGFEGSTVPNLATKQWTLGSGIWGVFDNGVGTTRSWGVNSGVTTPPTQPLVHSGANAAYMNNENIGVGNTSQDFLATPLIPIPANGELKFWTRTLANGNQGTVFKVMVSTSTQTDPAAYTLVQQWNEDNLTAVYNVYEEKTVNLSAFTGAGGSIYVAFVMEYTQPGPAIGGDKWLIDDVRIVEKCLDPTNLAATVITQNSAILSWSNPGNAAEFEIQVLPFSGILGANGTAVTGTSYPATGTTSPIAPFTPSTQYKFYVRAICAGDVASAWVGPFSFSTSSPGLTCTSPIIIPSALPYTTTDNTITYGDSIDVIQAGNCAEVTANYMEGNDVFYSYTPTFTGAIQITMTPGATYSGIFVYEGCPNVGVNCVAGVANAQNSIRTIPSLAVTAGTTYIIVLSSNAITQNFPYTLTIQQLNCAAPTSLTAIGTGPTSANLSWGNPGNATSWEVVIQTAGSPIPTGPGVTTSTNTNYGVTALTGSGAPLVLGTPYQYWVRANCGDGTFSIWSGPYIFNTTSCASGCNYIFTMTDTYGDGWNGNTMSIVQNGLTLATLTGPTADQGQAPVQQSVPMCDGPFELVWNAGGNFGNEIGVTITNSFGQIIYTKPTTATINSTLYTGTVDCTNLACLEPLSVAAATQITTYEATLSWTLNGPAPQAWEIFAVAQGSPAPTATSTPTATATTNPYTITGLLADTAYVYYVRSVCAPGVTSPWSAVSAPFTTLPTCPKPTNLMVTNVDMTSATLGWAAGASETSWKVFYQLAGLPAPTATIPGWITVTTNSLPLSSLTAATSYDFYVQAVCSDTDSSTITPKFKFNTLLCLAADQCNFTFIVADSFGDGWTGNTLSVTQNGIVVAILDGPTAAQGTAPQSITVPMCNNLPFELFWNEGGFASADVSVSIINSFGQVVYTKPAGTGVKNTLLFTGFIDCANELCLPPLNLVITNPTTDGATLSWTPNGPVVPTLWEIFAVLVGSPAPTATTTPTATTATYPYTITGLTADTNYVYYVRAVCSTPGANPWSQVSPPFKTLPTCPKPTSFVLYGKSDTTAVLGWTAGGLETSWNVIAVPAGSAAPSADATGWQTATAVPYTYTGLTAGTAYDFYVRGACEGDDFSTWTGPVYGATTSCPLEDLCYYTFTMSSQFPFGWNNNTMSVIQNGVEVALLVGPDWQSGGTPLTVTVPLCNNQPFSLFWNTVGYSSEEIVISIQNAANEVVFTHPYGTDLQGTTLFAGTVNCVPSACPKPFALAANLITETSAILTWSEALSATAWEVVVVPAGLPAPTATTMGVSATSPYLAEGLNSGAAYQFYVRAVCSSNSKSDWTGPTTFFTLITNDDCDTATVVPVNADQSCTVFASGSVTGATASAEANGCSGTANDDVWFTFTATNSSHSIELNNIVGTTVDLYHIFYSGTVCGSLTQMYCSDNNDSIANNLIIGQTYTIRVFTWGSNPDEVVNFDVCIGTIAAGIMVTDNQYTPLQLIEEILIDSNCANISNVTYSTGSNFGSTNGIGYFEKNGSTFPFADGIVLTTGQATNAAGPNSTSLSDGAFDWPGDADLEAIITPLGQNAGTFNATKLEFDFVPLVDNISFNFLFASEEYGTFQCNYADVFGFILTNVATGVSTNLAVLPNGAPISVTTIRDSLYNNTCESVNADMFGAYYDFPGLDPLSAPTNFNGITLPLVATSAVIPGQQYHIKLAIADYQDSSFDSAVFIEGGSFGLGNVDLGEDLLILEGTALCSEDSVVLNLNLDTTLFGIQWSVNGVDIAGANGPTLTVEEAGTYTIVATYNGTTCGGTDSIIVEFYPEVVMGTPENLYICGTDTASFNLSLNDDNVTNGSLDYVVTYHFSQEDAVADANPLNAAAYTNVVNPQTIYVRTESVIGGCFDTTSFQIEVQDLSAQFTLPADTTICEDETFTIAITPSNFDLANATYTWTLDGIAIADTTSSIDVTIAGTYQVTVNFGGCVSSESVTLTILPNIILIDPADVAVCDSYTLPALTLGNYFTATQGGGTALLAGDIVTTSQTIYVYAVSGTCFAEQSFEVTITPTPVIAPIANVVACGNYVLPTLAVGNYFTAADGQGTQIPSGTVITSDQTVYVFASTGTTPDCTASASYEVDIIDAVVLAPISDVTICSPFKYALPVLTQGNYFTQTNGGGQQLQAGDEIGTTQTIYVFAPAVVATCNSEVSFTVTVTQSPMFAIQGNCVGQQFVLTATAIDGDLTGATYNWTVKTGSGSIVGSASDATVVVAGAATYTLTVTVGGCSTEQDFVADTTSCMIQKGISPNGDGFNDYFDLEGQGVSELEIFNRYGTKVYNQNNYSNEWVGQSNKGNELPDGVYYYVIKRTSGENRTGWIYINR